MQRGRSSFTKTRKRERTERGRRADWTNGKTPPLYKERGRRRARTTAKRRHLEKKINQETEERLRGGRKGLVMTGRGQLLWRREKPSDSHAASAVIRQIQGDLILDRCQKRKKKKRKKKERSGSSNSKVSIHHMRSDTVGPRLQIKNLD